MGPFGDLIQGISDFAQRDIYNPLGTAEKAVGNWAAQVPGAVGQAGKDIGAGYERAFGGGPGGDPKAKPKAKAKETAAQKQAAETKALENQIRMTENNPWTKLGNALTQQYQGEMTQIAPMVSGAAGSTAQTGAANQALASLGLSSGSSAGQWLGQQTAAAQQTAAPVAQAMNQEATQMNASLNPISNALAAYAQANAQMVETAPEAGWLSALASHVTSNLSYYGSVAPGAVSQLRQEPGLVQALQQSGGYGGGGGLVPLTSLKVNPQGKVNVAATGAGLNAYGSQPGTLPGGSAPITSPTG